MFDSWLTTARDGDDEDLLQTVGPPPDGDGKLRFIRAADAYVPERHDDDAQWVRDAIHLHFRLNQDSNWVRGSGCRDGVSPGLHLVRRWEVLFRLGAPGCGMSARADLER